MRDHNSEEWITTHDAAMRAGVKPATIRKWHERGKVRGHRIGRILYVIATDIYQAEHATRGRYLDQRARGVSQ